MNQEHRDSHLIFFGKKDESLILQDIKELRFSLILQNIVQDFGLQRFAVLEQIHGACGIVIDDTSVISGLIVDPDIKKNLTPASWFVHQGDFLITNQKNIALVVVTGDCVPLVLYDPVTHVIGLVHAGWRGSYAGILQAALQVMQQKYGTQIQNLICSFGPSARACCYEVSPPFVYDFQVRYPDVAQFDLRDQKYYFDNSGFLQQLLKKFGIPEQNIYTDKALCTICNLQFCSFRREKEMAHDQITMVALF